MHIRIAQARCLGKSRALCTLESTVQVGLWVKGGGQRERENRERERETPGVETHCHTLVLKCILARRGSQCTGGHAHLTGSVDRRGILTTLDLETTCRGINPRWTSGLFCERSSPVACLAPCSHYRGTSLIRNNTPPTNLHWAYLGSYGGPRGGGLFPMSEVALQRVGLRVFIVLAVSPPSSLIPPLCPPPFPRPPKPETTGVTRS